MKYYLLLIAAVIIGQSFFSSVSVWYFQRDIKELNYFKALQLYFKREIGSYFVVILLTMMVMFVLSDWMDLTTTRAELIAKGTLTRFEKAQEKFRTYATGFGIFAQWIAFVLYKGGRNAIKDWAAIRGIDVQQELDTRPGTTKP